MTPDGSKVYVALFDFGGFGNTVRVINTATNTASGTITVGLGPVAFGNFISSYTSVGIESLSSEPASIFISPNPTSGQFTILLPTINSEISVLDITGREIIKTKASQKTILLQLNENGIYTVFVRNNQGTKTAKLIVNR